MATYYVSVTGSDTNNGTSTSTPWKTLSKVQGANLQPGDTVSFKRGDTFTGQMSILKSGTSGSPITFNAYGSGAAPKFIGTGSTINQLFYMNNRAYITFDGLEITDPTLSPTDRTMLSKIQRGFYVDGTSNNIILRNLNMTLVGVAIFLVGGTNTVDNCTIGNLRMVVDTNDGSQPGNDDDYGANPIVLTSSDNVITNNYFYDCYAHSFDYTIDGGGIEYYNRSTPINNNYIAYNKFVKCDGIFEIVGNTNNNKFHYNKFINTGSLLYFQSGFTHTNWEIYNNVFIENETPINAGNVRLVAGSFGAGAVKMRNNVFQLSNGVKVSPSSLIDHQYNIYKISGSSSVGYTLHSTEVSTSGTLFTSTTGSAQDWDLTPSIGSALINFGTDVGLTRDFVGSAISGNPDAGVIEKVGTAVLTSSVSATNITCNGGTSTVTVAATGGTSPYTGTGTFTRGAGTYTFTVTDSASGSSTNTITINQPVAITGSVVAGQITVFGGTTSLVVTGSGGNGVYTYKLDGGSYQSSNTFTGVAAGTHTITIKDSNDCTGVVTLVLTEPIDETLSAVLASKTDVTLRPGRTYPRNGSVDINAVGGTAPYTYNRNGSGWKSNNGVWTQLSPGIYSFGVKDATGAKAYLTVQIFDCTSGNCI